jgi:hypothetical protein
VSPVKYELGSYIPEDRILRKLYSLLLIKIPFICCTVLFKYTVLIFVQFYFSDKPHLCPLNYSGRETSERICDIRNMFSSNHLVHISMKTYSYIYVG